MQFSSVMNVRRSFDSVYLCFVEINSAQDDVYIRLIYYTSLTNLLSLIEVRTIIKPFPAKAVKITDNGD